MKVTYPTCCGVDVHKSFRVATNTTILAFNNSILKFKQWLLDNDCRDVCMESTGKYWALVFYPWEDEINITIANPKWVKAVKCNKDDTKDSKWIGDSFCMDWFGAVTFPAKKSAFSGIYKISL